MKSQTNSRSSHKMCRNGLFASSQFPQSPNLYLVPTIMIKALSVQLLHFHCFPKRKLKYTRCLCGKKPSVWLLQRRSGRTTSWNCLTQMLGILRLFCMRSLKQIKVRLLESSASHTQGTKYTNEGIYIFITASGICASTCKTIFVKKNFVSQLLKNCNVSSSSTTRFVQVFSICSIK